MPRKFIREQSTDPGKLSFARELRRNLTVEEQILWQELRGDKLGAHFRRQHIIADYVADFFCHSAKLIVEVDDSVHQNRVGFDKWRDATFQKRVFAHFVSQTTK